MRVHSWGRYPAGQPAATAAAFDRDAPLPPVPPAALLLPFGLGRSYGDVALNQGETTLFTRGLDRFMEFDRTTGVLRAEAGVSLAEVLRLVVPQGWFVPVTPGTRFVTLGGAVANDVHGKNHHRAGSFGCHVRAFELLRSDGSRRRCSPTENADWFSATIGGLGLTGLLTWVEIDLAPIASPWLWVENRRFTDLDGFWRLDEELGARHEYAVAWIDCLENGRGIYSAADFVGAPSSGSSWKTRTRTVPFTPPVSLINGASLRLFNAAYYHRPLPAGALQHYEQFFYPLDSILEWNRIYGRRGFFQYQCVLPVASGRDATHRLLDVIRRSGQGSFLAVLKSFGVRPSPGMLSFPREGVTLALDFPHRGAATLALFERLDEIVSAAGGALYPAKDARMPPAMMRGGYPRLDAFAAFVDPRFSSTFWRRVAAPANR